MTVADLAFYAFAVVTVAAGLMVTLSRNPVHSVLWLILTFLSSAGLFVLLGAEFVAMLLIIVYVGAVAVLFLFVVMMLDIDFAELKGEMAKYMPLGLLVGVVILMKLALGIGAWVQADVLVAQQSGGEDLGRGVLRKLDVLIDLHRHDALEGLGVELDALDATDRDAGAAHRRARLQAADIVEARTDAIAGALTEARKVGGLQGQEQQAGDAQHHEQTDHGFDTLPAHHPAPFTAPRTSTR